MLKKLGVMALSLALALSLVGCVESEEVKAAKDAMNVEISRIDNQVSTLNEEVSKADELLSAGERPLDDKATSNLENAVADAKAVSFEKPKTPSKLEDIQNATEDLKNTDYTSVIEKLQKATRNLETSIQQRKLVTSPTEEYVLSCLKHVKAIEDIAAITEETDENGLLNKPGSYTVRVVFSSPHVNQSELYGNSLAERGTEAGGSIEVFANEEDAQTREDYLAAYDGTILASGSHAVYGTVLIRTSNELTATQQKELEKQVLEALTAIDE